MKRVRYLAGAVGLTPVALVLAGPATAQAAPAARPAPAKAGATGKSVRTSGKHCDANGKICISIFGVSNDVVSVTEWITNSTKRPDTFVLTASTDGIGDGTWKSTYGGSWKGTRSHVWHPACSWANYTDVMAFATRVAGSVSVSVFGDNFTNRHPCAGSRAGA